MTVYLFGMYSAHFLHPFCVDNKIRLSVGSEVCGHMTAWCAKAGWTWCEWAGRHWTVAPDPQNWSLSHIFYILFTHILDSGCYGIDHKDHDLTFFTVLAALNLQYTWISHIHLEKVQSESCSISPSVKNQLAFFFFHLWWKQEVTDPSCP